MDKKQWFLQRWQALGDVSELLKAAAPGFTDPKDYLQKLILDEKNEKLAEKRLKILEELCIDDADEKLEVFIQEIRYKRDELLLRSDFSQLPDAPLTSEQKKSYREYRQYLRNLPNDIRQSRKTDVEVREYKNWVEHSDKVKFLPYKVL